MWLVGAGYWGNKLFESLTLSSSLQKFNVDVKIIDIKNGHTIDNIDTKDPVILATPLWQHYEQARFLLQRGHDLYVEKPMAETAEQVNQLRQLTNNDQIVMVGHLFVHHPQMDHIKSIIASGKIGQVSHITSQRLNWGIYQTKTDPLLSLAVHDISIIQEITNSTLHPKAAQAWNYSNNCQFDRVQFNGITDSLVTFDVDISWHWPVRTRETVIIGTQGQIVWDQDLNKITVSTHSVQNNRSIVDTNLTVYEYNYKMSPLEFELMHWVDCVADRIKPVTGFAAAHSVATVVDQVKKLLSFAVLADKIVS
jgi:predicted dehydrogenase